MALSGGMNKTVDRVSVEHFFYLCMQTLEVSKVKRYGAEVVVFELGYLATATQADNLVALVQ